MTMIMNNLYVSEHDPKLFKSFVSTSTKGVFREVEVSLTFYISPTRKTICGELKAYEGCQIIAKCAVRRRVTSYLDDTVREAAANLLEIAGFSEVSYCTLSKMNYRQARELVQELLRQLTDANPASTHIEITRDWRLS